MSAARRTIDTSVGQPFPDDDFDQSAPDFEAAKTASDFQRMAKTPAGFVDQDRDAQLVPAGRDSYGRPLHLMAAGTHSARVADRIVTSISVRQEPADGGVCIVGRVGDFVMFRSAAMTVEAAEALEGGYREMAYDHAPRLAPMLAANLQSYARVGRISAHLPARLGSPEDAATLARKLG